MTAHIIQMCSLLMPLLLVACADRPTAPEITVKPGEGISREQFLIDNDVCRQYSEHLVRNASPELSNPPVDNKTITSSVDGASGDAPVAPAAPTGRIEGQSWVRYGMNTMQREYDISYARCMFLKGHIVPGIQ